MNAGAWDPVRDVTARQAVDDHERNPEYELHVGRVVETDQGARRYVSVWLRGRRFHGWLVAGEPAVEHGADPRCHAGWPGAATGAHPPPWRRLAQLAESDGLDVVGQLTPEHGASDLHRAGRARVDELA